MIHNRRGGVGNNWFWGVSVLVGNNILFGGGSRRFGTCFGWFRFLASLLSTWFRVWFNGLFLTAATTDTSIALLIGLLYSDLHIIIIMLTFETLFL